MSAHSPYTVEASVEAWAPLRNLPAGAFAEVWAAAEEIAEQAALLRDADAGAPVPGTFVLGTHRADFEISHVRRVVTLLGLEASPALMSETPLGPVGGVP